MIAKPTIGASELIAMMGDRATLLHGPSDELPNLRLSGSDLDCVVLNMDLRWPLRLPAGWRLCQCLRYDLRGWYWVLERAGEAVAIDAIDDPWGLGRDAIKTEAFFDVVAAESAEAVRAAYLTVKRVRKRNFAPEEWRRIGQLADHDPERFRRALRGLTGPLLATLLAPPAFRGEAPNPRVVELANVLRFGRRFGSPARIVETAWLGLTRYVERIGHPAGFTVLLVGPDGAGKSTLAAALPELLTGPFKKHTTNHWRPGILPRPGSLAGRSAPDPSRPHARSSFGPLPSLLLLGYYWVDFVLGEIVSTKFRIRSGLIVSERGWWDIAVDPRRYRLDVPTWLVRGLGSLLRGPDLAILLTAPSDALRDRKRELERPEIDRQLEAWGTALPARIHTLEVDTSEGIEATFEQAREGILSILESRAVARLGAGWASLPRGRTRWWLPRGPAPLARGGLAVHRPVTSRGRVAWSLAHTAALAGGLRLLPRGPAPPASVRRAVSPYVPHRGSFAVSQANHPSRYGVLLLEADGSPTAYAKVALDGAGAEALAREGGAIERLGSLLPPPLRAPSILAQGDGLLVLKAFAWRSEPEPWVMPDAVASALGTFFKAGSSEVSGELLGPAHGDMAPWNVLPLAEAWALIDWESAEDAAPPFHDVCHFFVQAHTLLGRPSSEELLDGFRRGRGWVGRAVGAHAEAAGVPPTVSADLLVRYLRRTTGGVRPRTRNESMGLARRRWLMAALDG